MFTGLVEAVGTVTAVTAVPAGRRLVVDSPLSAELQEGDSVAVNGVCLTVVTRDDGSFAADVSPETARVSTFGEIRRDAVVNLERPLKVEARLGGHFVLGHVDGPGRIAGLFPQEDFFRVGVSYPPSIKPLIVQKGSIAVDGISLTVAALVENRFEVQIVPFTWEHTNLRTRAVGDVVNLECDIIGKYVLGYGHE